MAADTSLPRIQPIAFTALVAVLTLVGLKFVFDSYFTEMFEHEEYVKVGSVAPRQLLELRAREAKSFAAAPIPIERAMEMVARARASTETIRPEPSNDMAALVGWAQLPKTGLGSLPPPPAPPPSASAAAAAVAPSAMPAPSSSAAHVRAPNPPAASAKPASSSAKPPAPPASGAPRH